MPEMTREELLEFLKTCNPRARNTFIQMVEGKVSEKDSTAFVREKLSFLEPDLTPRELTFVSNRLCNCGAIVGDNNKLVARAECCGVFTCEMCNNRCIRCGNNVCKAHSIVSSDGEVYCSRCKWFGIGWKLVKKGVSKWFGFS